MLQSLYRFLCIHSEGYVNKKVIAAKFFIGLFFVCLAIYGLLENFSFFIFAFFIFAGDYAFYRALLTERFYNVERCGKQFDSAKLLYAEGANRPITEHDLKNPAYSEETEYILERIQKEGSVLEIGCGLGKLTSGALKKGADIISTDFTLRSLKTTGEIARRNGYVANRVLADAQHLPFKSTCFNMVIASSVIEHLEDDVMGFEESIRVLKTEAAPSTRFHLATVPYIHSTAFFLTQ